MKIVGKNMQDFRLKQHQLDGVKFMLEHGSAILADEMGLGKTAQALSYFAVLYNNKIVSRLVVVVPYSLLYNWRDECIKVLNHDPYIFHKKREPNENNPIIIITYSLFSNPKYFNQLRMLCGANSLLVMDEAHKIKSITAKRTKTCLAFPSFFKVYMTGTPIQNKPEDLFIPLHLVAPKEFPRMSLFADKFLQVKKRQVRLKNGRIIYKDYIAGYKNVEELRNVLQSKMLRRLAKDCLDLPEKNYDYRAYNAADKVTNYYISLIDMNDTNTLVRATKLQQALSGIHPELEPDLQAVNETPKFEVLADLVEGCQERLIIWCKFRASVNFIYQALKDQRPCYTIEGATSSAERNGRLEAFRNTPNGILIATIKTAGEGLNLTECKRAIFYEVEMSPALNRQAEARIHRIGQTERVFYHYLYGKGTVEEAIMLMLHKKQRLTDVLVEDELYEFSRQELDEILKYHYGLGRI